MGHYTRKGPSGARVFKGRSPPAEKRRVRKIELGNDPYVLAKGALSFRVHRRRAEAARKLRDSWWNY